MTNTTMSIPAPPPLCLTDKQVTIIHQGRSLMADSSHPNFKMIREAVKNKDWEVLPDLFEIEKVVEIWSEKNYSIQEDKVLYKGKPIPAVLAKRVIQFFSEGLSVQPLLAFHTRLSKNPSFQSVEELFSFLEHKNIPIDEEGFFYAYKAVNPNFTDIYTGKVDNSIGQKPRMERNQVDDNRERHCSQGYHVGSLDYVKWYMRPDSVILICKVDPADVVSVPTDHSCQKVRVTGYEVVELYTGPLPETVYRTVSETRDYDDDEVDDWEHEFDEDGFWDEDEDPDEYDEDETSEEVERSTAPAPIEVTKHIVLPSGLECWVTPEDVKKIVESKVPTAAWSTTPAISAQTVEAQDVVLSKVSDALLEVIRIIKNSR